MVYTQIDKKIVVFILALLFYYCDAGNSGRNFQIYKLQDGCPENSAKLSLYAHLRNIKIKLDSNNTHLVQFDLDILEDIIDHDLKLQFQVTKCKDKDSLDSCEMFHSITIPFSCQLMDILGPWSSFIKDFQPPLTCPFRKGIYHLPRGVNVTPQGVGTLRVGNGYYLRIGIKVLKSKSNTLKFCGVAEGQI